MKKKLKIFFVICLLLIVTGFNSLKVNADSQTLSPIIFDGYTNYTDFQRSLDGSSNVYILIKINENDYDIVNEEFKDYLIEGANIYISPYVPYMSISYDFYSDFIFGYYQIEELSCYDYFEYIFICDKRQNSSNINTGLIQDKGIYSWKKVLDDIGLSNKKNNVNVQLNIGILENDVVQENMIKYNNSYNNTVEVVVEEEFHENIENNKINHATVVCSIIAEITKNVSTLKFFSTIANDYLERIDWFCENNVKVVNISWGDYNIRNENLYTKLDAVFDSYKREFNIVFVKSAGNYNEGITSPGKGANVITVGATDSLYNVYEGSGYSISFRKPTVVAPGVNLSLDFMKTSIDDSIIYTGTSFSCAITTGAIALLYAQNSTVLNNSESINSVIIAGAVKLNKSDNSYNIKSGFGLINYELSEQIVNSNEVFYFNNVGEYENINSTLDNYASMEIVLFTLARCESDFKNNINYRDEEQIIYNNFKIIIRDRNTNDIIAESIFIDNIVNLKISNLSNNVLNFIVEIVDEDDSNVPFAIAIKNYGEYNIISEKEIHYYDSKYDLIFEEHNFIEEDEVLRCSICQYEQSNCDLHEFVYTENYIECSNCSYIEFMDDIIVTDPNRYYECGSQINLYEDEISIYERSYKGNNIIQGYTRLLYFDSENIPSSSRLDYDWTSSDNSIAIVSKYGTVTALSVDEERYVTIIATYKFNSEIKFYKKMLIQPDTSNKIKSITYTVNMKVDEKYVFKFPDKYVPTQNVINYDWIVPCQKEEFAGVKMSSWGTITAIAPGIMYINGWYNYNPNVIVTIKVIVET